MKLLTTLLKTHECGQDPKLFFATLSFHQELFARKGCFHPNNDIVILLVFSKELVSLLLAKCDAGSKDYNLFYIAVEIGIQKKGKLLIYLSA